MRRNGERQGRSKNSDSLGQEVADVVSQLGLGAAGGGRGFDDSDFAPSKAGVKLGAESEAAKDEPAKPKKSKNKFKQDADAEPPAPRKRAPDPAVAAAIQERSWNAGVGERPGLTVF